MKKSTKLYKKNKKNGNIFNIFNILLLIAVVALAGVFLYGLYKKEKTDSIASPASSPVPNNKPKTPLKMGESLAGISWNAKISAQLRGKAEPFKIVFDSQNTGHIEANQKTLDFLFNGKNTFTYSYQGKGSDLYHMIINNELWQLSFTRINDILEENPTFLNMNRPSGIVVLNTERAD